MLKDILNLEGVSVLDKKQQRIISGGGTFACYCGFEGGPFEDLVIYIEANDVGEALNSMGSCGGHGATCTGV